MMNVVKLSMSAGDSYLYYMEKDREDTLEIGQTRTNEIGGEASRFIDSGIDGKSLHGRSIDENDFASLHAGLDPNSERPLSKFQQHKFDAGIPYKHAPGWDINWAPDKSVSAVWALADDNLREKIAKAHTDSINRTMQYLEAKLAYTRTGPKLADREKLNGLTWARFDHMTSRALDPQLHSHVLLFNSGRRENGQFAAVDSYFIFKNQKLLDSVYMAEYAQKLEKIGFELDHNKHGGFKIVGVPQRLTEGFSTRHQQVLDAIDKFGYSHPKGYAQAATYSRDAKKHVPVEHLFKAWKEQGHSLDFTEKEIAALFKEQQSKFKARSVGKEISSRINSMGADHTFKQFTLTPLKAHEGLQKPKTLQLIKPKDIKPEGLMRGVPKPNQKISLDIGKDIGKASKSVTKGVSLLTKAALPTPAATLLKQATKILNSSKKVKASRSRLTPSRAPQRGRNIDRDR